MNTTENERSTMDAFRAWWRGPYKGSAIGLLLGAAYGLIWRGLAEIERHSDYQVPLGFGAMMASFVIVMPAILGYITVNHARRFIDPTRKFAIFAPMGAMLLATVGSVIL